LASAILSDDATATPRNPIRQNARPILALVGFKRVLDAYRRIWVSKIAVKSLLWGADADEDVGVPSEKARLKLLRAGGFFSHRTEIWLLLKKI
jgi:hypothetical protein